MSRARRSRWVHPETNEIVKFMPHNPPERGQTVLVDGERHRVLRCPVKWDGRTWRMKRGVKVRAEQGTDRRQALMARVTKTEGPCPNCGHELLPHARHRGAGMTDPIHYLTINFDGGYQRIKLNCPETGGCQPPGYCSECGRERGEKDKMPCDCCVADDADFCNVEAWCMASGEIDWVQGEATVPVEIDWSSGEEPTLVIVTEEPTRDAEEQGWRARLIAWWNGGVKPITPGRPPHEGMYPGQMRDDPTPRTDHTQTSAQPANEQREARARIEYIRSLAGVCGDHGSCKSHPCIHSALDALALTIPRLATEAEARRTAEVREVVGSLADAVDWYVQCLEYVAKRRPVRNLDEVKAGYYGALTAVRRALNRTEV